MKGFPLPYLEVFESLWYATAAYRDIQVLPGWVHLCLRIVRVVVVRLAGRRGWVVTESVESKEPHIVSF